MGKLDILKKLIQEGKVAGKELLEKVPTVDDALKLKGPERDAYLKALDEVYGPVSARQKLTGHTTPAHHGTFKKFEEFMPESERSSERFLGKSLYFTTDPLDASANYAKRTGSDNIIKFNELAYNLQKNGLSEKDAYKKASEIIYSNKNEGEVLPVMLREGNTIDLTNSLGEGKGNRKWVDLRENADKLRTESGKPVEFGKTHPGELLRQELKARGYETATLDPLQQWPQFPDINEGAKHIMVQNPNQVRSVNAAFDPRFKDSNKIMAAFAPMTAATDLSEPATAIADAYKKYIKEPVSNVSEKLATGISDLTSLKPYAPQYMQKPLTEAEDTTRPLLKTGLEMGLDPLNYVNPAIGIPAMVASESYETKEPSVDPRQQAIKRLVGK